MDSLDATHEDASTRINEIVVRLQEIDDTRCLYWKKVADDIHSEYQFLYDTM